MPSQSQSSFIGIELSGSKLSGAVVNSEGTIMKRAEAAVNGGGLVAQVATIVTELSAGEANVGGVGIAIPGLVNRQSDRVIASSFLPSTVGNNLHAELMKATGLRVELENDANAAAYGEYLVGAGRGSRDMFYITIGEGIGGAIILDGKLWTGSSGFAGEVGHITIDTEGAECLCGNRGCLETVASAPNIVRRANERLNRDSTSSLSRLALNKDFTADDMAREATEGDDFALMMLERTGKYIGQRHQPAEHRTHRAWRWGYAGTRAHFESGDTGSQAPCLSTVLRSHRDSGSLTWTRRRHHRRCNARPRR